MKSFFRNKKLLTHLEFERVKSTQSPPYPFVKRYSSFLIHRDLRIFFASQTDLLQREILRKLGNFRNLNVELNAQLLAWDQLASYPLLESFSQEIQGIDSWKKGPVEKHWELLGQDLSQLHLLAWPLTLVDSPPPSPSSCECALEIPLGSSKFKILWDVYGPCQFNFIAESCQVLVLDSPQIIFYYHLYEKRPIRYPRKDFHEALESLQKNAASIGIELDKNDFRIDYKKLDYI